MNNVYVLIIEVNKNINVNVGALGNLNFEKGIYAYVGSAKKGLNKRIERHLKKGKPTFWHIDYLLNDGSVKVLKVFTVQEFFSECEVAKIISERGFPMQGFGSSDCKCLSHLFKIRKYQFLRGFMQELQLFCGSELHG
ncbi:MAG: GIY-YIG nuclease family protein [Candidatus Bathyarchaeota archaeon]|nr:GIY-YIG nuclease family protein [Candidatus Bathyarchaeota archaeon]